MSHPTLFSSGFELSTLVTSAALLRRSWAVIGSVDSSSFSVEYEVSKESDLTIIAFVANRQLLEADLVSSSDLSISHFKFLCTKSNPSFSVNKSAIELFCSLAQPHDDKLNLLKSQIDSSTPLIVTGHALGASVASLFTLWLLDTIGSGKKRPLCITFGSPLIGDQNLQQAISRSSTWNSCFLHLVYCRDPLLRSFLPHPNYKPFGTFLLCSESGASCFENPDSILEALQIMGSNIGNVSQGFQGDHYRKIVEDLNCQAIYKEFTGFNYFTYSDPLKASIVAQLQAIGLAQMQQQQQNIDINILVDKMARECARKKKFDPSEKLNRMKINMANLEWYKKESKTREIGYYDAFKNEHFTSDYDVVLYKKKLALYWKDMVAEAEMKPQKEGAAFRTRWLFAGTNYRRMVEPLDIAEYYRNGGRDYEVRGRLNHYIQLEKWLEEDRTVWGSLNSSKKQNVESILTLDSCFWAHVEEAVRLCKALRSGGNDELTRRKLSEFEDYVFGLLKNYAVSPEIFLKQSSYMSWWKEYEGIVGVSYHSALANFMRNPSNYKQYSGGAFDFY